MFYNVRAKGGIERRRELPAPCFNAIKDALEAQGRPIEGLDPEESVFGISHQTYYAYLRKYAHRAGLTGLYATPPPNFAGIPVPALKTLGHSRSSESPPQPGIYNGWKGKKTKAGKRWPPCWV